MKREVIVDKLLGKKSDNPIWEFAPLRWFSYTLGVIYITFIIFVLYVFISSKL